MSSARSMAAMPSLPQWSCACGTGAGISRRISFATDVRLLDHFAPLRVIGTDESAELLGRVGDELDALRREFRFHVGTAEHAGDFGIHPIHDFGGCLCRHEETEPRID